MPAFLLLLPQIIQGIQVAINAAPQVVEIVESAKNLINGFFAGKLITKEQQDALHAHIDSISAMAKSGIVPPAWQVRPDPQ